jgi:hypothetical protein
VRKRRDRGRVGSRRRKLVDAVCGGEGGLDVALVVGRVFEYGIYPQRRSTLSLCQPEEGEAGARAHS